MIDALNIATMPIADKVHRHMLASYNALQLDACRQKPSGSATSSRKPTRRQPYRPFWLGSSQKTEFKVR